MDNIQVTPHRSIPGVGLGVENKDSIYQTISYTTVSAEKVYERSPLHRTPLGEHNKSGLLSGVQRVLIKSNKSHHDDANNMHMIRSPNNFMKPTEASRINNCTPVRGNMKHTPSPRSAPISSYFPVTPAADSANILHFVSPQESNPMQTPTRPQSTGRVRTKAQVPPSCTPPSAHRVTPTAATEGTTRPIAQSNSNSKQQRSALASPPGRVAFSPARVVARDGNTVVEPGSARSNSAARRTTGHSYMLPTASSQMLFSPDAVSRAAHTHSSVERSPQVRNAAPSQPVKTDNAGSAQVPNRTIQSPGSRPASAPRARPQALSVHLKAHSEHLKQAAAAAVTSVGPKTPPHTGPSVDTTSPASRDDPSATAATSGVSTTPMTSPSAVPSTQVPKLASPTPSPGPTGAHTVAASKLSKPPAHSKPLRTADVLSANKAAKLAALAAHAHSNGSSNTTTAVPVPPVSGLARYAQPTRSSAAATSATLMATAHNKPVAKVAHSVRSATVRLTAPGGIAAGISAMESPDSHSPTPPRNAGTSSSSQRRQVVSTTTSVPTAVLRRKETERTNKPTQRTAATEDRRPGVPSGKSKVSARTLPGSGTAGKAKKNTADVAAAGAASAVHSDSIMHILEGHDTEPRSDSRLEVPKMRRSCSFGSELSCVEGGYELMYLGGSMDFSEHDTLDGQSNSSSNLSGRAPTPAPTASSLGAPETSSRPCARPSSNNASDSDSVVHHQFSSTQQQYRHQSAPTAATERAPLRLQVLEDTLANLSGVEAPASFSPSNLSNFSNFSQGTFGSDMFAPIRGEITETAVEYPDHNQKDEEFTPIDAEVSCIRATTSTHNLSNHSENNSRVDVSHGGIDTNHTLCSENAWAKEYTSMIPAEISRMGASAGKEDCSQNLSDESDRPRNIAATLSFTAADMDDASSSSLLQLPLEADHTSVSPFSGPFAPSPLPQYMHTIQHHHHSAGSDSHNQGYVQESSSVMSTASAAVASVSDPLNQAMMMSHSYSASCTSLPSLGPSPLSLIPPRLQRQFSDDSRSCNISAITPIEAHTFGSMENPDLSARGITPCSTSYQPNGSVVSAETSASTNILDRAMIASTSCEQDWSVGGSTTSISPFLRPHSFSRSNSASSGYAQETRLSSNTTAEIRAHTVFCPPPPPKPRGQLLAVSIDPALTASQQFDSSVDALFATFNENASNTTADERNSPVQQSWEVGGSVESLPPPPPPPLEDCPTTGAECVARATPCSIAHSVVSTPADTVEEIQLRLVNAMSEKFRALRGPSDSSSTHRPTLTVNPAASITEENEDMIVSPLQEVPRLPSFGSVHSMSLLCSTDSAEVALAAAVSGQLRPFCETKTSTDGASIPINTVPEEQHHEEECVEDVMNLTDDYEAYSRDEQEQEDAVNLSDDAAEFSREEQEDPADCCSDGGQADCCSEGDAPELQESDNEDDFCMYDEEHSEGEVEDCWSESGAEPSDLQQVSASIQSINTSRLGQGTASSTNVSCSYSSSVDELMIVNPVHKCARWVAEHYPQDSISSSSSSARGSESLPTGLGSAEDCSGIAAATAHPRTPSSAFQSVPQTMSLLPTAVPQAPFSRIMLPSTVREEWYRSSSPPTTSASSTTRTGVCCPDPVAGQLFVMGACDSAAPMSKASFRTMQSVFVPVDVRADV